VRAWAILQLREGVDLSQPVATLEHEFQLRWPGHAFRFPAVKQGCLDAENPLSAYVFVEPPIDAAIFERSAIIGAVLKDPSTRRPTYVTEQELAVMMPLPPFPPPGSAIMVTAGDYTGLEAVVVEVNCANCRVLIELWSRQVVLTLAANEFERV